MVSRLSFARHGWVIARRILICSEFSVLLLFLIFEFGVLATIQAAQNSRLNPQINAGMVTLWGNTRPEAVAKNDRGRVPDGLPLNHMMLQLQRPPEREQALQQFIQDLHDPTSPLFHHWITAEEFGRRYGPSSGDISRVTAWLGSQGFKVNLVYSNRMVIDFTGTAGQIRQAFHTEIHNLQVNGQAHFANMSDPQIPEELASTVAGVVSLNDFRPRKMLESRPMYTPGNGAYPVAPADLWTIYNFSPAFTEGYTGQGQTILLVEDSDIYSTTDWNTFRSTLGIASSYSGGSLSQVNPASSGVTNCIDPGINDNDDEVAVDVEWASAAAPNAAIMVASCLDTATGFGGFIALQNLLNAGSAPPPIVSISYGETESAIGATFNAYISTLYQQAVTEGVSVFVSSGDSGPANSDRGAQYAQYGINVSGYTSTPYNVSVGGTDFADTYQGNNAAFWNTVNAANYGSALSYIPEIPWNDSCASVLMADWEQSFPPYGSSGLCSSATSKNQDKLLNTIAGGGGPSGCATGATDINPVVGGTCAGYAKPGWQAGLLGNPSDGVRDIPDVSLFAANGIWGHYYVACFSDPNNGGKSCSGAPSSWSGYGGTSISAPIMAGIQALINQASGSRWGNPNPTYYALAGAEYGAGGSSTCNSALGNQVGGNCIFNDITQIPLLHGGTGAGGDIDLPCGWINCYEPGGSYGVLSTAPQTVNYLQLLTLGSGYTSAPTCSITGGGGAGAACGATLTGVVNSITLTHGGSGYTDYPICTLTGGGGTGATCGVGVTISNPPGTGFVSSVSILTYGAGYTSAPTCTLTGGGGSGATCAATAGPGVSIDLTATGSGYTTVPHCAIGGGGGTGATCMALEVTSSNAYQPAYSAGTGWDFATGIGTVNASNLVSSFLTYSASLAPTSLVFAPQTPFTSSAAQSVMLSNTGTSNLAVLAVTIAGTNPSDFAKSADSCSGVTLLPSATCSVSVTFTPTYAGTRSAFLSFTDAARQSQSSVTLTGIGAGPGVTLSPLALIFPSQIIGTSTSQTVSLSNPGDLALTLTNIAVTGSGASSFGQTNNCASILPPAASCTFTVTFTADATGSVNAGLTITDNALDSPQSVNLTGTAAVPVPFINQPLTPPSAAPGSSAFTLTVTGTGFASGAAVDWNGSALATTFVSSEKLTATVPAAKIASSVTAQIMVVNPGLALASNAIPFPISAKVTSLGLANAPGTPLTVGTQPESVAVGDFNGDGKMDLAVANVVSDNVSILLSNGDGTFTQSASPVPVGVFPISIAAGDFNGDGKLDLVTSNTASQNLTILLGNGDGTFTASVNSPIVGTQPQQVVVGDFNGDGKLDVAVADSYANGIKVLLGNGDGTFTPVAAISPTGNGPIAEAVGDFNGDGKLDLAVVNQHGNTLSILLGNGDGTFTLASSPTTGTEPFAIAAGDLNGDGKLDLAVVNAQSNNVTILLGNGDGTFTAAASPAAGSGPAGIALGDLNGDGILDLAIANQLESTVNILLGKGDGTFIAGTTTAPTGQYPNQLIIGDFNGDGRLDLATANAGANNLSVLLQLASGPAAGIWPRSLAFPLEPLGTTSPAETITITDLGTASLSFSAIGITGPFAIASGSTCSTSTPLAAGATCTALVTFSPLAAGAASGTLSFADNAAGSPQTVSLSGTGTSVVATLSPLSLTFLPQSMGTTSPAQSVTLTNAGTTSIVITTVSLSGANATDFAKGIDTCTGATLIPASICTVNVTFAPTAIGTRTATLGFSDNALGSPQTVTLTGLASLPVPFLNSTLAPASVAPGGSSFTLAVSGTNFVPGATIDWNGKALATNFVSDEELTATVPAANIASPGTASISVVNPGSGLSSNLIYLPITQPRPAVYFAPAPASPITVGTNPSAIAVGDFNGDGILDMAVANSQSNNLTILLGKGNGAFTPAASSPATGELPMAIAAGDFNGDGKLDLAVVNASTFSVTILLGNGNGTFTPVASSPSTWSTPLSIVTGDFNQDGKLDLAIACEGSGYLTILLGNGDGTFKPAATSPSVGNHALSLAVGDFNQDGRLDLAVVNEGDNTLTILLGKGDGTFSPAGPPIPAGDDPEYVAVADFNADGKLDLAVADFLSGVTILLGNGDGTFTPTVPPSAVYSANALSVGDFNGDGKLDLALGNGPDYTVLVLLGNGDGTFTANPTAGSTGFTTFGAAMGDFTGDGKLDLAYTTNFTSDLIAVMLQSVPAQIVTPLPGSIDFGNQDLGATSAIQTVKLYSWGTSAIAISSITASPNFAETNNCGATLASGTACAINVTFTPTAPGALTGTLTIADNSQGVAGSTQTVALSGIGLGPAVSLSATQLNFASQTLGSASPAQSVTVTNCGTQNLTLSKSAITGTNAADFAFNNDNCTGATVAPNGTCSVNVYFTPAGPGARSASLNFTDNAAGSPQIVTLSGTGTGAEMSLAPASLTFPATFNGTSSAALTVTLKNAGNVSLILSAMTAPAPFAILASGTTCSTATAIAAGSSCTVAITFTPTSIGDASGNLTFTDNAPGSPQSVALSGTGQDFTFAAPSGSPTNATATPGQAATFTLSLGGKGGMSGNVAFACTGTPSESTCTVSPNPVTAGSSPANVTVTVTTTAPSAGTPRSRHLPPASPQTPNFRGLMILALALASLAWVFPRGKQPGECRWLSAIPLIISGLLLALALGGCGGGGGGSPAPPYNPGTPAGTYTLTVTGTAGSGNSILSHSVTLTLTVS